jgi:hypothetical protein
MTITPLLIEILLHCHYSPEPHPRVHVSAIAEALAAFMREGMIEPREVRGCYQTTERGAAWVEMLCATPFPVQAWIDPRKAGT